jgi:cytidine deaminase
LIGAASEERAAVVAQRLALLVASVGAAVAADVSDAIEAGSVLSDAAAQRIAARHGLASIDELALLALPAAAAMARAPISGYRVPAVGIEADSGDVLLGANLEFPGTELSTTIHAEGFVPLRARRRGRFLRTLAVTSARPCAHCRQTLAESAAADGLTLVDLEGHRRSLEELYPLAFRPGALGVAGDEPGSSRWAGLELDVEEGASVAPEIADALAEAGATAHAPYSRAPSAVALVARDGSILSAACVESVAFNPSISAMQAALVELVAARIHDADIADAWLARTVGGAVDPEPAFRALVRAALPSASPHVVGWRPTPG